MSVLKSKRGESSLQFLDNARALEVYSIKRCMHFPKRATFYISQPIAALSQEVLNNVKAANSIYPRNQHEAQMRRDCFIRANNALQAMISQLDIAHEVVGDVSDHVWLTWMKYISDEAKLISGAMKSDQERYKNLV